MDPTDGEMPPFHYGSHYSSAGASLFWLLRLEPYTTYAIELQSGKFDHADRLFFSMQEAWASCNKSISDVRDAATDPVHRRCLHPRLASQRHLLTHTLLTHPLLTHPLLTHTLLTHPLLTHPTRHVAATWPPRGMHVSSAGQGAHPRVLLPSRLPP